MEGSTKGVAIYGAGVAGKSLARYLLDQCDEKVCFFLDDNPQLAGTEIIGIPIESATELELRFACIKALYIAMPSSSPKQINIIRDAAAKLDIPVLMVPNVGQIMLGRDLSDVIDLSDLIRDEQTREIEDFDSLVKYKSVLVVGGAGSIGAKIAEQLTINTDLEVIVFDSSELGIYHAKKSLLSTQRWKGRGKCYLGNATDYLSIVEIITRHNIDLVINAAAYKHVAIVEENPFVAAKNNILSACVVSQAAMDCNIKDMIFISTDKAVRPTSLMGATKNVGELIVAIAERQARARDLDTRFCAVRFGNVLGSSGSVLHVFREQLEKGGPLTITHKNVNRYFMTMNEAARLVLVVTGFMQGSRVYLLRMGEPILIRDLAERLAKAHGLRLVDGEISCSDEVPVIYTQLGDGEKIEEELLVTKASESTDIQSVFMERINLPDSLQCVDIQYIYDQVAVSTKEELLRHIQTWVPSWQISQSLVNQSN